MQFIVFVMEFEFLTSRRVKEFCKVFAEVLISSVYPSNVKKSQLERYTQSKVLSLLKNDWLCFIALDEGNIVGFRFGTLNYGVFSEEWMGVVSSMHGKGIQFFLLNASIIELKKLGCHKLEGFTLVSNEEAIQHLIRNGFSQEGVLKKHWYGLDYILWSKII